MEEFIWAETRLNPYDWGIDPYFRQFNNDDIFIIIRRLKNGLYLVCDKNGNEHRIAKRHLSYFNKRGQ